MQPITAITIFLICVIFMGIAENDTSYRPLNPGSEKTLRILFNNPE